LGIGWKRIQPYNIKCRMVAVVGAGSAGGGGGNIVVKFELQVYRVREERYMLDIQRLDGPLYCFMDLVDRLLSVLQLA
jgi:5'-AMP-activated protein kinase catalytic alpha subunit